MLCYRCKEVEVLPFEGGVLCDVVHGDGSIVRVCDECYEIMRAEARDFNNARCAPGWGDEERAELDAEMVRLYGPGVVINKDTLVKVNEKRRRAYIKDCTVQEGEEV